jgi:hypothetical protein
VTAPLPTDAPCTYSSAGGWAVDTSLCTAWAGFTAGVQTYASLFAKTYLWAATGRRFGLCDITIRPCWNPQLPTYLTYPSIWNAGQYGGQYAWGLFAFGGGDFLMAGCGCGTATGCSCKPPEISLPMPAVSVLAVVEDGVTLAPTAYRLDGNQLVRQDGKAWHYRQNLALPNGQPDTWSVEYLRGEAVPPLLNMVAGIFACEVAKSLTGQACRMSGKITSMTRQGVTAQFASLQDLIGKGMTGITEVDQVIRTYNPKGLTQRPRVLSSDLPDYRFVQS